MHIIVAAIVALVAAEIKERFEKGLLIPMINFCGSSFLSELLS
jgi:hypothetical protein